MPLRSRLTAFALVFIFLFTSSGVRAVEPEPTGIAILGLQLSDSSVERQLRNYLYSSLSDARRLRVVPEETTQKYLDEFSKQDTRQVDQQLEEAYRNFIKGKKLYESLSVDEAIKTLSESVRVYRENIGFLHDNRLLLSSHLYLGMALYVKGRVPEGKTFIRQMVVLDPLRASHELPRREYPPKIVNLHAELAQEVVKGPAGTVTFKTEPRGAAIYFDAIQQPTTPHEMTGIPVGEHFVTFELKGYRSAARRVTVRSGTNKVEVALEEWKPFAPYAFEKRKDISTNEMLVRTGTDLNAPLLALAHMSMVGEESVALTGQIYDIRSKEFSKIIRVDTNRGKLKKGAQEFANRLVENITNGGLVVAQISIDKTLPSTEPIVSVSKSADSSPLISQDSILRKWWFWTAVGVVAIGAGGYLAASSMNSSADYNSIVVDNPFN